MDSQQKKKIQKILAVIVLIVLLVVPFINWKLGGFLWVWAWLCYILYMLFNRPEKSYEENTDEDDHVQ